MTRLKGQNNLDFARVGFPTGNEDPPILTDRSHAPLCDEFGRLILRVDGIINLADEGAALMDTTTWLGTSLNAGYRSTESGGFHNVIPIAGSEDVDAVTKVFGFNNSTTPGYIQLWYSNDLNPGSGSKELILVQPIAALGNFSIEAHLPFHVFGGALWLYMVLVLSSDPLLLVPMTGDSLWANWNYISKNPYA